MIEDDFFKKFPDPETIARLVALFIQDEQETFAQLQKLIREKRDLLEVMLKLDRLLERNNFDSQKYSSSSIWFDICKKASPETYGK